MKKLVCMMTALVAFNVAAQDAQTLRDQELIRELESTAEFKQLENEAASGTEERQYKKTRLLKVKLAEKGTAKSIAKELGLKLISGKKRKVATFKVRKGFNVDAAIAQLESHPGVKKVKREVVVNKNTPK
ncbi:S8 family serine peptidase [Marinibactrum halimedae]|uniref:ASP external chaperone domain-containing protein n=1 Tax=Marinibactrum halimedae TaxID=1444977 RepID=A0AA37WKF7_9GAMM|nr:hypothetical protein [Marinibactrum halimedae]MCD9457708.1 hypothetical protein [Marinibactrum halimedae]GLS24918.1 hypothetical protein GCM10007877_06320 [Marinibactrum halimedae]